MHRDDPPPPDPPEDDHPVADAPTKPVACGTHRSGHDPHHMQHRFCCQETDPDRVSRLVDVIDISDRGWITFELDGAVVRRWSHHVERLREAVAASDGTLVEVSLRWKLLTAYRPDLSGAWVFSLSGGPSPCGPTPR
jgi:hypothetical protein